VSKETVGSEHVLESLMHENTREERERLGKINSITDEMEVLGEMFKSMDVLIKKADVKL